MSYELEHVGRPLTEEELRLLQALVAYPTKAAAAKSLGIARSTIYYRLRDEDLRAAYESMRAAAIADARDSLMHVAESAVAVLHGVAQDPDVPAQTRVQAAGKVLDLALKAHELTDIQSRIDEIEQAMNSGAYSRY
jgi:AcrR family transcriptional regulator